MPLRKISSGGRVSPRYIQRGRGGFARNCGLSNHTGPAGPEEPLAWAEDDGTAAYVEYDGRPNDE